MLRKSESRKPEFAAAKLIFNILYSSDLYLSLNSLDVVVLIN